MPLNHVLNDENQIGITKYRESTYPILHSHDFYEIEYVISGKGTHIVEKERIPSKKGDLYFTNISTEHAFVSCDDDDPIVVYNIVFHPNIFNNLKIQPHDTNPDNMGVDRFIPKDILNHAYTKVTDAFDAGNIIDLMYNEIKKQNENYEEMLKGLLLEVINIIVDKHMPFKNSNRPVYGIDNVLSYINDNYSDKITIDDMAKLAMMSPSYFCAKFKEAIGITAIQYLTQKRLESAKKLLDTTDLAISEITVKVGYDSESFFRKNFKAKFGMSPASYRIEKRKNK